MEIDMTREIVTGIDDDPPDWAAQEEQRLNYAAQLARDVEKRARDLRVTELARAKVAAERAAGSPIPPFDAGTLREMLARPKPPVARVDELIPWNAGALVVAQRKTGKTTFELNIARALLTGEDFLGRFAVRPVRGNIGFLNYEVSGETLAAWAADQNIDPDRLYVVNLRGRRNPLAHDADCEALVAELIRHEVESLMVDPFGRAFTGTNQNDPGEVGAWLTRLDQVARGEANVLDVILAAHAGWNGERTRGSTALDDWADTIITLVRDKEDDQQRFIRAEGRDVLLEEDQLLYDTDTRTLALAGAGSRRSTSKLRQLEAQIPVVLEALRDAPSLSGNALDKILADTELAHSKGDGAKAARLCERRGIVGSKEGPRRSRMFFLITSPTSLNLPEGNSATSPTSLYREGSRREDNATTSPAREHDQNHDQEHSA